MLQLKKESAEKVLMQQTLIENYQRFSALIEHFKNKGLKLNLFAEVGVKSQFTCLYMTETGCWVQFVWVSVSSVRWEGWLDGVQD